MSIMYVYGNFKQIYFFPKIDKNQHNNNIGYLL